MPLAAGIRLGLHEVLGPLGAGGMGEVYREQRFLGGTLKDLSATTHLEVVLGRPKLLEEK